MIPKILHYCWIGGAEMPELAKECIASWKKHMPDWEYKRWDESNFDIAAAPLYVKQAYEARKFAFVSDYVRLWALEQYGGLYMDVDFEVFRPFDELMDKYPAFAGYEGSKRQPVMQGVLASEPHGAWVRDMLSTYENRTFYKSPLTGNPSPVTLEYDMTPNTSYFSDRLEAQGFVADGVEKDFTIPSLSGETANIPSLHIFPVYYFCPVLTTGEDVRTPETYCIHRGLGSWNTSSNWRTRIAKHLPPKWRTRLIKLKRKVMG